MGVAMGEVKPGARRPVQTRRASAIAAAVTRFQTGPRATLDVSSAWLMCDVSQAGRGATGVEFHRARVDAPARVARRAGSVAPATALIAQAGVGRAPDKTGRFRLCFAQGEACLRRGCTRLAQVLTDHAARG
jgi:hypothetical protein